MKASIRAELDRLLESEKPCQALAPGRDIHGQLLPGTKCNPTGVNATYYRKPVLQEVKRQLAENPQILANIVAIQLTLAQMGDEKAFKELRDMLDGRPAIVLAGSDDPDAAPLNITVKFVGPEPPTIEAQ